MKNQAKKPDFFIFKKQKMSKILRLDFATSIGKTL